MIRGVNVSGQKRVKMEDIKEAYDGLGLKDVKTYIQSGNVVFNVEGLSKVSLANNIQEELKKVLDIDVIVIIRDINEFQLIVDALPFKMEDTSKCHVTFLLAEPREDLNDAIKELNRVKSGSEQFHVTSTEIYLFCPNGYGRTKLSNNFIEKTFNVAATTRNWNTVSKLVAFANQIS